MLRSQVLCSSLAALLLAACGPAATDGGGLELAFARQALESPCPEEAVSDPALPPLDRLEIKLLTEAGAVHFEAGIDLAGKTSPEVGGIPEGEGLSLDVLGLVGGSPAWRGGAESITIVKGRSAYAKVLMTPLADMACARRPLHRPRAFTAAAPLADGRVLLAGGADTLAADACGPGCAELEATAAVDLFDSGSGSIYPAAALNSPRALATATPLSDGKVLVVGGVRRLELNGSTSLPADVDELDLVPSFEVYIPWEDLWIEKPLPDFEGRVFHTATPLGDGRVLVCGGGTDFDLALDSAIVFDPAGESVGDFVPLQRMNAPRFGHAAVRVGDKVLLIGGAVHPTSPPVEDFSISDENFNAHSIQEAINLFFHSAVVLPLRPDEILVAGGAFLETDQLAYPLAANARLLSVSQSSVSQVSAMAVPRMMAQAVALDSNLVLVAGGFTDPGTTPSDSAELFDPSSEEFRAAPQPLSTPRAGHAVAPVVGGRVLSAGGLGPDGLLGSGEIYTAPTQ